MSKANDLEKKNVLIVDDHAEIRRIVRACVEEHFSVNIIESCDGLDAIKNTLKKDIHLVVTDLNMPIMNGLELTGYFRNHSPLEKTPVIMLTSERSQSEKQRAHSIGVNDYLHKPFSPDTLLPLLERYLT